MNRHVKCALLAGAAWGVLAGATVAQDAEAAAQAANACLLYTSDAADE